MFHRTLMLCWLFFQSIFEFASTDITSLVGSTVELKCQYQATSTQPLIWLRSTSSSTISYSSNDFIFLDRFLDIKKRVNITGNHNIGEYHLRISDVRKSDAGSYTCTVGGKKEEYQLTVLEGPSSASIDRKSSDNKLQGTEDLDITISCLAEGGDPAPDMVLQIRNQNYTKSSTRTIHHIISRVDRSYDGDAVRCLAGYQSISYFPKSDTATIYLYLKSTTASFSPDQFVAEETNPLSITCKSSDGRPKPTVKWSLANADITSQSTEQSTHDIAKDTYTVTSKLIYSVHRNDNGKILSCGFKNTATGNSYLSQSRKLDVKFSPSASIENKTYNPSDISRQITCNAYGNPVSYTFLKWKHKSKYGTIIRMLDGNSTLTLPQTSAETRYQDTGEYICTVSNGIKDKDGNVNQQATGFVVSQASPIFHSGNYQLKFGQFKEDVEIYVSLYSEPKYTSLTWLKGRNIISSSAKYTITDVPAVMTDTFHNTKVQVDGYRLTLTIRNLEEQDFVNYTLRLANGVGQNVEHSVVLISASPPVTPLNVSKTNITDSTITLQWIPGFDGGHEQMFVVQYRVKNNPQWQDTVVPMTDHASNCRCSSTKLYVFTLTGLKSETFYEIRIYAEHKFNRSHPSNIENVTTKPMSQHSSNTDSITLVGVAVGLSTVIIISLVINCILTYKILKDKRSPMKSSSNVDSKNGRSFPEVYYNISDDAVDKDDDSDRELRHYETLGTKDKPNEYDVCEPNLRNSSSDVLHSKTDQNYETVGTKDKPNVYEDLDEN